MVVEPISLPNLTSRIGTMNGLLFEHALENHRQKKRCQSLGTSHHNKYLLKLIEKELIAFVLIHQFIL